MAMIWMAREMADDEGRPTGHYRMAGQSDESPSYFEPGCDCENGHGSAREAESCPKYLARYMQQWGVRGSEAMQAIDTAELNRRFSYHAPDDIKVPMHENARALLRQVAGQLNRTVPPGREAALMMTHLEEAMFWANAAIARTHTADIVKLLTIRSTAPESLRS